ncbi:MAG: MFS transporter [Dysgonamonadaceae bacterium]|jgi:fucose permease|nr:MFS transporter [Dysgonamonadaceae bacterium]
MKQHSLVKTLPVFMAFYVMGFVDIAGVATNYVKMDFDLSNTVTQILTMMIFVWFALLSIPIGVFQDKKGKKLTVNLGILFTAAGMLAPVIFYNYYSMLVSFVLLGIGNTIVQVSASPLMQDVSSPDKLSRNLTFSQFVKAIAGILGPVIAMFCAVNFGKWTIVYWVYLTICIISILCLYHTRIEEKEAIGRATVRSTLRLLCNKRVALLTTGTFLMVGFDVGMNTNIINYLRTSFAVSQEEAGIGISVYFAGLMAGRFLSALILNKVQGNKMLLFCAVLSIFAFVALYLTMNFQGGQAIIFLIGLFSAAIFPLIFSAGLQYMPQRANELSGLMIMSVCGGAVIPPFVGVLIDKFGVMEGLALLGLCLAYVIFLAVYMLRQDFHINKK